ncbi:hypothetical protein K6Y31_12220 [Motilimonas cestriensis]|uniref:Long-chain-fatty-acyl-CoA reductase n=1 Tax=Motilimonas cestriensis TaxID=2742685 RepID=A0ABS8WD82_9GAMM|nr:acyl-CoA reductase [Motilimonas cestriensis]MCE2595586.1 hypothetical protein [Motilimonas cestriensis]
MTDAAILQQVRACKTQPILAPFSPLIIEFLQTLSQRLLQQRDKPEVMSLGFWLRRAQVMQMAKDLPNNAKARGLAFHITPANVDTQFVYSWALSLLCGNLNVVRLSQRRGDVAFLLERIIKETLAKPAYQAIESGNIFVEYPNNSPLTAELSSFCDLRIIWGGDETIKRIQSFPIPAHAHEVSFGNKISGALLDAKTILELDDIKSLVHNFYNDVYWFNQQGCSSPKLIFWLGADDNIAKAKVKFWSSLNALFISKQTSFIASVTERYALKQQFAAAHIPCPDNIDSIFLRFALVNGVQYQDIPRHLGQGLFYERDINTIDELEQYLPAYFQTLITNVLTDSALTCVRQDKAILRLADIGQALAFSHHWDGMNLLEEFCDRN